MKRYGYLAAACCVSVLLSACGSADAADTKQVEAKTAAEANKTDTDVTSGKSDAVQAAIPDSIINIADVFSKRDLSGDYDESECGSIVLADSGSAADCGGVSIDGDTVTITAEGDYIVSGALSDGMIIVDVEKTQKVQLVLDGAVIHSNSSAAIYVKQADKVFITLADGSENTLSNGGEFIAIDENNIDAVIFSKEDLTLNGTGSLVITSPAGHGVVSKDDIVVTGGTYDITASSHGLAGKDSVCIADGNLAIEAGKDAIHSENDDDDTLGYVYIEDGVFLFSVESDGISAVNEIYIAGGDITVSKSYEGIEARLINICGGRIDITSADDGLNATDKRGTSDLSGEDMERADSPAVQDRHFGGMDTQEEAKITIAGGEIYINAEGDGIDTNGYLAVNGGEIYVAGPSNSGNGALDYGISASISGGTVIAAGQSGMAQNFGSDSTQGSILVNTQQQQDAGTDIVLLDSDGRELLAWTAGKRYNSVVISCPEIMDGGSYTVKMGDSATEITMDGLIYGEGDGFGGMRGGGGFGGGERPDGFDKGGGGTMPDNGAGGKHGRMQDGDMQDGSVPEGDGEPPEMPDKMPDAFPDAGSGQQQREN